GLAVPPATVSSSASRPREPTRRGSRRPTGSRTASTMPSSPSRAGCVLYARSRSAGSVEPSTTTTGPAGSVVSSTGGRTPSWVASVTLSTGPTPWSPTSPSRPPSVRAWTGSRSSHVSLQRPQALHPSRGGTVRQRVRCHGRAHRHPHVRGHREPHLGRAGHRHGRSRPPAGGHHRHRERLPLRRLPARVHVPPGRPLPVRHPQGRRAGRGR